MKTESVVRSDPEILSGTPVFTGTRVPFRALLDYLEGEHALFEFLGDFPTVTRQQAVAALEVAGEAVSSELWKLIEDRSPDDSRRSRQPYQHARKRGHPEG